MLCKFSYFCAFLSSNFDAIKTDGEARVSSVRSPTDKNMEHMMNFYSSQNVSYNVLSIQLILIISSGEFLHGVN